MTDHIKIIKPGVLSTLQDGGRSGFRSIGIGPGGVMDQYAFHVANRLLGNDPATTVIEMHFPAPVIEFNTSASCCLSGADFQAKLNDELLKTWSTFIVKPGDILQFEKIQKGFRCYLAIQGGFTGEEWLGSRSTNLNLRMGGYKGRALQKGDCILIGNFNFEKAISLKNVNMPAELEKIYDEANVINCLPGPEWNLLNTEAQQRLLSSNFSITVNSNRMACLLEGENFKITFPQVELLSSAVLAGTVQFLPNGSLAVLMTDHQTTGGFPRILQVLQSQLPKLAQTRPGSDIQFRMTDIITAEADFQSFMKKCLYE